MKKFTFLFVLLMSSAFAAQVIIQNPTLPTGPSPVMDPVPAEPAPSPVVSPGPSPVVSPAPTLPTAPMPAEPIPGGTYPSIPLPGGTTSGGKSGGAGGGTVILTSWGAACKSAHQGHYGSKNVTCPIGWCEDDSTCGCTPCNSVPVCAICSPSTGCPSGTSCEMPGSCQSLVCVETVAYVMPLNLSRFTTSGLTHDGAVICDIHPGATTANIGEKLKDEKCREIYRILKKHEQFYP